jgi:hypothetical protein
MSHDDVIFFYLTFSLQRISKNDNVLKISSYVIMKFFLDTRSLLERSPSSEAANCAATQELPSILWNPKVHYRVHKSTPLVATPRQISPIHTIASYLSKIYFLSLRPFIQGIRRGLRCFVMIRNKLIFYGEELFTPRKSPSRRTPSCRLSATANSVYSQLPSKTWGRLLHPQPEEAPCRGDEGPT